MSIQIQLFIHSLPIIGKVNFSGCPSKFTLKVFCGPDISKN